MYTPQKRLQIILTFFKVPVCLRLLHKRQWQFANIINVWRVAYTTRCLMENFMVIQKKKKCRKKAHLCNSVMALSWYKSDKRCSMAKGTRKCGACLCLYGLFPNGSLCKASTINTSIFCNLQHVNFYRYCWSKCSCTEEGDIELREHMKSIRAFYRYLDQ